MTILASLLTILIMISNLAVRVTINGPAGSDRRYTTDGSEPSASSTLFTGAFVVDRTLTVKARSFDGVNEPSSVASLPIIIRCATPIISPPSGSGSTPIAVTLTCATPEAAIRYTTDGSDPTETSALYAGAFAVSSTAVVKARAFLAPKDPSQVASGTFTIQAQSRVYFGYSPLTVVNAAQMKAMSNAPEAANSALRTDVFGTYVYGVNSTPSDYFYFWAPDTMSNPSASNGFFDPVGTFPIAMAESGQGFNSGVINGYHYLALTIDGVPGKLRRTFYPIGGGPTPFTLQIQ